MSEMPPRPRRAITIDGVRIDDVSEAEAVAEVAAAIGEARAAGRGANVVTPNVDHLWLLRRDAEFRRIYDEARLVLCDGRPLLWVARRQGTPFTHGVVPGSQFFVTLCEASAARGWRVFLLGGATGRAEEAAALLTARLPSLAIASTHCPPPGFERDAAAWDAMRAALDAAHADAGGPLDLVFLALGAPKSEKTAARLLREGAPPAVYVNVGAAFDFVCGRPRRAPALMRRLGLEWLWRLALNPRRLFKRYILHDLPLLLSLLVRPRQRP